MYFKYFFSLNSAYTLEFFTTSRRSYPALMKEDRRGLVIEVWYFCSGWSSLVSVFIHFPSTFCYFEAYAYPSNCNTGQKGYNFPLIKKNLKREHNHHKLNKHCTFTQVFFSHLGWWDLCSDGRRMCEGYDVNLVNALIRKKKV